MNSFDPLSGGVPLPADLSLLKAQAQRDQLSAMQDKGVRITLREAAATAGPGEPLRESPDRR